MVLKGLLGVLDGLWGVLVGLCGVLGGLGAPFVGSVVLLDANMAEKGNKRLKE